ncbi:hypothetical protein AGLY_008686 [Aphis glycines]|uniref:Uncharacterized protein n=1 Tax=Aphis glycines TaxID=307491 RepID=A0A6G0TKE6_APHGL|nr:hypothetical protein AGLY_008686 [Aphis glycines]
MHKPCIIYVIFFKYNQTKQIDFSLLLGSLSSGSFKTNLKCSWNFSKLLTKEANRHQQSPVPLKNNYLISKQDQHFQMFNNIVVKLSDLLSEALEALTFTLGGSFIIPPIFSVLCGADFSLFFFPPISTITIQAFRIIIALRMPVRMSTARWLVTLITIVFGIIPSTMINSFQFMMAVINFGRELGIDLLGTFFSSRFLLPNPDVLSVLFCTILTRVFVTIVGTTSTGAVIFSKTIGFSSTFLTNLGTTTTLGVLCALQFSSSPLESLGFTKLTRGRSDRIKSLFFDDSRSRSNPDRLSSSSASWREFPLLFNGPLPGL